VNQQCENYALKGSPSWGPEGRHQKKGRTRHRFPVANPEKEEKRGNRLLGKKKGQNADYAELKRDRKKEGTDHPRGYRTHTRKK